MAFLGQSPKEATQKISIRKYLLYKQLKFFSAQQGFGTSIAYK